MSINTYLNILLSEADDEPKKKDKEPNLDEEPDMPEDEPDTEEETIDEPTTDEEPPTEEDAGTDEEPVPDGTGTEDDFSMDDTGTDDMGGDDPNMDDTTGDEEPMDGETTEEDPSTGEEGKDKLKSIKLAQSYRLLYTTLNGIIDKVYDIEKKNEEENEIIEKVIIDLTKIKNILFDYIDKCFLSNTYEKNLFNLYYFENSIKLTTQMVQKIKELRQKN